MNRICVLNSSKKVHLSTRNGFIELCRFIFAMCIVSHHFLLLPTQSEHYPLIGVTVKAGSGWTDMGQ